ncbi:MAG TPA: BTAD domain-containing putative transcriptional regulator [Rubrobacter sp.]|nr:BTAD domain-containing putative transcriptional regulator [Rubrobacter sp.]
MARHHRVLAEVEHKFSETTIREPEAVRIGLLGGFRVSVGTRTIEEGAWRLRKAASLVKVLALARGHRLHRERVMDLLWPQLGVKAASNNLRGALHVVRRTLASDTASRYLELQGDQLVLCPRGQLWVDVDVFEETAATARRSRDPAAYRAAIDLYAGELLPGDRYEEWTERRREELRQLHLALLTEMAGLYEAREQYERGIEALRRVLSEEPAREEAHTSLMRLYVLSGKRQESILQYERLRTSLTRELDVEPGIESRQHYEEIRAGESLATGSAGDPSKRAADPAPHNLPASVTSFVGREREMIEARRLLSMTRLLTLAGAGGSGKTRLALEISRDLAGLYQDGVWFVELAPLSGPDLVAQEVAGALEVQERPGQPLTGTLVDSLRDREMLLVLDNCEHLIDAAARLADELLYSCPRLRVLATSRETLGIQGEVVWQVKPLSLPEADGGASVEGLMLYEAVRLFVDRARLRLPDFELMEANAGAVSRVCRKLDGMPLAIELATARMGALVVDQVAQRLEGSLDVLSAGSRTAEPRQQTLRATIDWSHELLSQTERALFRRLSIFTGGWTLEAAEDVCSGESIYEGDVLDLLGSLVNKSLVVVAATGSAARYRMLEPIRQYAREKLEESGEIDEMRSRHAAFFLALSEQAEPELSGTQQRMWVEQLEGEHDNLREAVSWVLEREGAESALRFGGALWRFWFAQGHLSEGRKWMEQILAKGKPLSTLARVKALEGLGWLAQSLGDPGLVEATFEEMLSLSRKLGDKGNIATALNALSGQAMQRGDHKCARELLEENLSVLRELEEEGNTATPLKKFHVLYLLAYMALNEENDPARAAALWEEDLTLARQIGDVLRIGMTMCSLGYAALLQGDYERARALCEETLAFAHELGSAVVEIIPETLVNLGLASLGLGDHERASASFEEALTMSKSAGRKPTIINILEAMASLAGALGEASRTARLWGAAEAARELTDIALPPGDRALHEPYLADARLRLGEAAWEEALSEGRAMTTDQATDYAFSKEEADPTTIPVPQKPLVADELTPREREIAILVARGLTNRQVSTRLGISERTAGNHVARILRKLGLSSRAQIATWATELHLLTPHPD